MKRAIVWFRNDLRLHDNEALTNALLQSDEIIPVYIFDSRVFNAKTNFGFSKTGKFRAKFIIESVANLRKNLKELGSDLFVACGKPEEIIYEKAREWKTQCIFCNRERTQEELDVQDQLEKNLWSVGQEVRYYRGKMLFYTADLPFPITHCPDLFTGFRKETENFVRIREPLDSPKDRIKTVSLDLHWGEMPKLEDFGHEYFEVEKGVVLKGGEDAALDALRKYFWETDHISHYKETRNGLLGDDYSSKFSSYLSAGCLSPKLIYYELKRYEQERVKNDSTYWLFFELMWRDFFRFMAKKYENKIFKIGGIKDVEEHEWSEDMNLFNFWKNGQTGIPFVDANMKELNATGFMSNRGRQNVASFLINDLKLNWLMGAEYFESLLIDYDPCSNYGNWNYLAGVGSDPREHRYFNILTQAKKYDPKGEYVKYWLPELEMLSADDIHQPDQLSKEELENYQLEINKDYPQVCFSTKNWS